jgi:hypothetical protein
VAFSAASVSSKLQKTEKGGIIMRTLTKTAVALSFIGATAIGTTATVQAQGVYFGFGYPHPYYHHYYYRHYPHYYGYYGGGYRTWNGCPHDWTIQGGVCKPYRHGPWDYGYGWYR